MSYVAPKGDKDYDGAPAAKSHKIRITLTSKNVKNLEKGASPSPPAPLSVSLRRPRQPLEGQGPARQGPGSPPDQVPDHHDAQDGSSLARLPRLTCIALR